VTGLARINPRRGVVGYPIHLPTIKTSATAEARSKTGHFCRPLLTRFRHGGFDYQHIHRERISRFIGRPGRKGLEWPLQGASGSE
jgi:hypothetical protein